MKFLPAYASSSLTALPYEAFVVTAGSVSTITHFATANDGLDLTSLLGGVSFSTLDSYFSTHGGAGTWSSGGQSFSFTPTYSGANIQVAGSGGSATVNVWQPAGTMNWTQFEAQPALILSSH